MWTHLAALCLIGGATAQIRQSPSPTELIIETDPHAVVRVDDNEVTPERAGSGRFVVRNPQPGAHLVRANFPGQQCHKPFTQKVTVVSGQATRVRAVMPELTGDLQIFTTPGARIELDGSPSVTANERGEVVLRALSTCREHRISATHAGYNSESRAMTVAPEIVSTLTIELRAVPSFGGPAAAPPKYSAHRRLTGPRGVDPMALFSPDSGRLITWTAGDPHVMIWDTSTGRQLKDLAIGEQDSVRVLAASPDLRLLAAASEREIVRILEVETGREVARFGDHQSSFGRVAVVFSPDGKRIAIGGGDSGVWDTASGKRLFAFPRDPSVAWILFTPDGRQLVTANTGITVWDAETGAVVRRLSAGDDIRFLTISPDGRLLGIYSRNEQKAQLQIEVRTAANGEIIRIFESEEDQNPLAFTADSMYLIAAGRNGDVHILDPRSGKRVGNWQTNHNGAIWSIAASPSGEWLVTCTSFREFSIWRRRP